MKSPEHFAYDLVIGNMIFQITPEYSIDIAKRAALSCVDEIIKQIKNIDKDSHRLEYWNNVKSEIEKL